MGMERWATISDCGTYRYDLGRRWSRGPILRWVMLNPSNADADVDDPTIRRCIGFARQWDYGGILVHNLYALRSPNPSALVNADDPIGPKNATYLATGLAMTTVAAWGADPAAIGWWNGYPYDITKSLSGAKRLRCLGTTVNGQPRHPLYVKGDTPLQPWINPNTMQEISKW